MGRIESHLAEFLDSQTLFPACLGVLQSFAFAKKALLSKCLSLWEFASGYSLLQQVLSLPQCSELLGSNGFRTFLFQSKGLYELLAEFGIASSSPALALVLEHASKEHVPQHGCYVGPLQTSDAVLTLDNSSVVHRALLTVLVPPSLEVYVLVTDIVRASMASRSLHFLIEVDEVWARMEQARGHRVERGSFEAGMIELIPALLLLAGEEVPNDMDKWFLSSTLPLTSGARSRVVAPRRERVDLRRWHQRQLEVRRQQRIIANTTRRIGFSGQSSRSVGRNSGVGLCRFWRQGICRYGSGCRYRHA